MFAVIEAGGKQYRVEAGDVIDVELMATDDDEAGTAVEFDRVLMVGGDDGFKVGSPAIAGALVKGSLIGEVKGPKIRVFKFKRRKQYRRTSGHRQRLTRVKIEDIAV